MINKFNFKSQICTTREQSERLIALGLKKETADIVHFFSQSLAQDWTIVPLTENEIAKNIEGVEVPAWSLHRLIEMMPQSVTSNNRLDYYKVIYNSSVCYQREHYNLYRSCKRDLYEDIISCIEWLIKEGYFNKEYLEE